MPDLFENAARPYLRMSEGDACSLQVGFKILDITPPKEDTFSLPLRMGIALEPMINQWLADQGLTLYFVNDDQINVAGQDPERSGHPDGYATIADPSLLTWWAKAHLPTAAIDLMSAGELMLSEIKTMNPTSWNVFARKGLDDSVALFRKYKIQVNSYLATVFTSANDELWEDSKAFRDLLRAINAPSRPRYALVTGFNIATREFAFEVRELDLELDARTRKRLEDEIIYPMRVEGRLPDPSYDGTAPECWWCDWAKMCPAVLNQVGADSLDAIDVTAPGDSYSVMEVEEMLGRLIDITETVKQLNSEKTQLSAELEAAIGLGNKIKTPRYQAHFGSVQGRLGLDKAKLAEYAERFGFKVDDLYTRGAPSKRLYKSARFGPQIKEESSGD